MRAFGRLPKHVDGTSEAKTAERKLAKRFKKARQASRLTAEHEAGLTAMDGDATQLAEIAALMRRERCRAAAESRTPLIASAAGRALPLTGAFQ